MESITALIENETFLAIVATVVATLWSAFRTSEFLRDKSNWWQRKVLDAVARSVARTYEEHVKEVKEKNEGKLPADEHVNSKAIARNLTLLDLKESGYEKVARRLTRENLDNLIQAEVARQKGEKAPRRTQGKGISR